MEKERRSFVKRVMLLLTVVCLLVAILGACNSNGTVESIEVDENSNAVYYMLDGFNISTLKLRVTYDSGDVNVINVEKSMLNTESQNKLKESGWKEITINYQGKSTTVTFYLAEEGEQVVEVTFKDASGNKISSVKTLVGGSVEAPVPAEIEGQVFRGWVDSEDKEVDLKNIQDSITVTAAYTTSTTKYTVRFYDYKGNIISEQKIEEGGNVYAPTYNKPAGISSYTWNTTFPIKVVKDESIYMTATENYYSVDYAYAFESSRSEVVYLKLHEDVKYGEKAQNFEKAKKQLPAAIAEAPIDSTTIYKDTTFFFVLVSERINITVYNNQEATLVKIDPAQYLINSTYTFPSGTGIAISGFTCTGWRIYNGSTYSSVYAPGSTWKVSSAYGKDIKIVPYYTKAFASVNFNFIFSDVTENDKPYTYSKIVDDVYEVDKDTITYDDIVKQLHSIKNTNNGAEVNNNTELGRTALRNIQTSEITSVTYGTSGTPFTVNSTVEVKGVELKFDIKLSSLENGTSALGYTKVIALYSEPTVTLPSTDKVTVWFYNNAHVPCFPYVFVTETFDYTLLTYQTKYVTSEITAPGYYRLDVEVGTDIPAEGGWYTYNTTKMEYTPTTSSQTKTLSGVDYYGYYIPAGYAKASVTANAEVPLGSRYYVYNSSAGRFEITNEAVFSAEKTYFVRNYLENTTTFDSGYFIGYQVSSISVGFDRSNNVYLPNTRKEEVDGNQVARPVVSVAANVFSRSVNTEEAISAMTGTNYVIASLPQKLIKIGDYAFVGCQLYNLTDFSSVSYIGEGAFAGAILSGNLSFANVQIIEERAFALMNVLATDGNATLTFNKLIDVSDLAFAKAAGKVTLSFNANLLDSIGNYAFFSIKNLQSITGLDKVTVIGYGAFASTPLTTLSFPNLEYIIVDENEDGAFANMRELTSLYLGGNGTLSDHEIDLSIIEGSKNLIVLSLGKQGSTALAAAGDGGTTEDKLLSLTGTLTDASEYQLKEIYLPASLVVIPTSVLAQFDFLEKIVVPASCKEFFTYDGVLFSVEDTTYTFYYYPTNKMGEFALQLPESAETLIISPAALGEAEITAIDLTRLSDEIGITVETGVLNAVVYGIKTNSVDAMTVYQLSELGNVYLMGTGLTESGLQTLISNNNWDESKVALSDKFDYHYDATNKLLFKLDVGERTASLIKGYRYAESITVPASLNISGQPYSVNAILEGAFYGFENLKTLNVLARLLYFPEGVFGSESEQVSCDELSSMTFAGWVTGNTVTMESFRYTAWFNEHTIISAGGKPFGYNAAADDQVITATELTESGFTTSIDAEFFKDAENLLSISLPASITNIEADAFNGCEKLTTVDFNRVTSIGDRAFAGCISLKKAIVNNLGTIGESAFEGCTSLTEFVAPELTRLSISAFKDCESLESVNLQSLQSFATDAYNDSNAFMNCAKLTDVQFSRYSSDTLPGHVFYASGLRSFKFTEYTSITTIGDSAFGECTGLQYVLLSSKVIIVGEEAFAGCTALRVQFNYSVNALLNASTHNASENRYEGVNIIDGKRVECYIYDNAFEGSTVSFYVNADVNVGANFLQEYSAHVTSQFPTVNFSFFPDPNISFNNIELGIAVLSDRIYFEEPVAPDLSSKGLTFIGWSDSDSTYSPISFPVVWTSSRTIYAKYISQVKGTLDPNDVDYIYLAVEQPELEVEPLNDVRKLAEDALYEFILHQINSTKAYNAYLGEDGFIDYEHQVNVTRSNLISIEGIGSGVSDFLYAKGISDEWGETVKWFYKIGEEAEVEITAFPLVITDVDRGDKIDIYAKVTSKRYVFNENASGQDNCIVVQTVTKTIHYNDVGEFGYAIVNYSSLDSKNIVLPTVYSDGDVEDGGNGEAPVIAVYAGAFGNDNFRCAELTLPSQVKAIFPGYYQSNSYTDDQPTDPRYTFNEHLTKINLPSSLLYVGEKIFYGLSNLESITFGNNDSQLLYVSREDFVGSKWYKDAVLSAEGGRNNGFIMAGRTAVEYVGTTSSLFTRTATNNELETVYTDGDEVKGFTPGMNLGWKLFDENNALVTGQELKVYLYGAAGIESTLRTYVNYGDAVYNNTDKTYTIVMKDAITPDVNPTFTFILYARETAERKVGDVKKITIAFTESSQTDSCYRFITKSGEKVTLPNLAIKVVDGILKDFQDMISLTINNDLVYVGKEAFSGSSLTTVSYTDRAENCKVAYVGKDAFAGTPWYSATESIILGTVYLKYNNTGTGTSLGGNSRKVNVTIPSYVTRIAEGAFRNATSLGGVTFSGKNLKVIEKDAFAGSGLISITLPSSVNTIMRGAFKKCATLTDVRMDSTQITKLEQDMFYGCTSLVSVLLPSTVKELGKNTFRKASALKTITASGLNELDVSDTALIDTVFYDPGQGDDDTYIILGNVLVRFILGKVNANLAAVNSDAKISAVIPNGVTNVLMDAFYGNTAITSVSIPSSVTVIGKNAFADCTKLTTVTFVAGSGLKKIGDYAFSGCTKLTTISLPNGLQAIGEYAFSQTAITTEVLGEDEKTVLSDPGFTIPDTVQTIGRSAFYGVETLSILNLGSSLREIGLNAFVSNGGRLYRINWNVSDSDVDSPFVLLTAACRDLGGSDMSAFFSTNTTNYVIRFYFPSALMTYLDANSNFWYTTGSDDRGYICKEFGKESSLPTVTLRVEQSQSEIHREVINSISDLGEPPIVAKKTFVEWVVGDNENDNGAALEYPYEIRTNSLVLTARFVDNNPDEAPMDNGAGYTIVTSGTGSSAVVRIDTVSNLKTLYVPDTIGNVKVTSIDLSTPNNTVEKIVFTNAKNFNGISGNIFAKFTALKSVVLANDITGVDFSVETITLSHSVVENDQQKVTNYTFQVVYGENRTVLIAFIGKAEPGVDLEFIIPAGVTTIAEKAFINSDLASIYIPKSVSRIDSDAFNKEIKKLKIETDINITQMNYAAFSDRTASSDPAVNSFWEREGTSSSVNANESPTKRAYVEIRGMKRSNGTDSILGYYYAFGNILLGYKYVSGDNIDLPDSVNGFNITVLASNTFNIDNAASFAVNTMELPTNIVKINTNAFVKANVRTSMAGTNEKTYSRLNDIADDVFTGMGFYENSNSGMLILGAVLVKAQYTATTIVVPDNIQTIMKSAFDNSQASTIVLGNSVSVIGASAFAHSSYLTAINIPNSVTTIGSEAFNDCAKLSNVRFDTVGSALSKIGDSAFMNCVSLTSINLPANLKEIGSSAFWGCNKLVSITFEGFVETADAATGEIIRTYTKESRLQSIGESAFNECTSLTAIKIPDGVEEIKSGTFTGCKNLLTVEFNESSSKLKVIGVRAFSGCVKLGSQLYIQEDDRNPSGYILTQQGSTEETGLVTLRLPNSLTRVEAYAFENCRGLWGVLFNYNIDYLGNKVFDGCVNLTKVVFYRGTAPTIEKETFEIGNDALYRLRIYVRISTSSSSEGNTYGSIMQSYIDKWENIQDNNVRTAATCNGQNIKFSLYERNDAPTLTIKESDNESSSYENYNVEYYIMEITSTNPLDNMKYIVEKQGDTWYYGQTNNYTMATGGSRNNEDSGLVKTYGSQTINQDGLNYVVIVVDYDEMTIALR